MNSTLRAPGIFLLCATLLLTTACKKNLARSYDTVGNAKLAKDDFDGAIADYTHAIELDPKDNQAYFNRGVAKEKKGDLADAIEDYTHVIELDPHNFAAYGNRGIAKARKKDLDGAIADYTRSIELNPKDGTDYYNRGLAERMKGDLDRSITDYDRAIELDPKNARAYNQRGLTEKKKGDLGGASADFDRAIELDPKNSTAYDSRGYVKQTKGDLEGAIEDYTTAIVLNPKDAYAYGYRANAKAIARQWPDALADYRLACDASAENRDYPHLYIFLIRARLGETNAARKELAGYLAQRLKDDKKASSSDWVSKVGGYLLGSVTESDLLAAAASPDAKKESGQLCEAWFYTGMKKLLAGDKQTASGDFHKCLDTKRADYVEYQMAASELKALGE